jgi:hypothetical protein
MGTHDKSNNEKSKSSKNEVLFELDLFDPTIHKNTIIFSMNKPGFIFDKITKYLSDNDITPVVRP